MNWFLCLLSLCCFMPDQTPHRPDIVLVVDDDPSDLYLADYYMQDFYCVVTAIKAAKEALKRVAEDWFDYGFLDFRLDTMNAIQFLNVATPHNIRIGWYVMSDFWYSDEGWRYYRRVVELGAQPILKSSRRIPNAEPMRSFRDVLNFILKPKTL